MSIPKWLVAAVLGASAIGAGRAAVALTRRARRRSALSVPSPPADPAEGLLRPWIVMNPSKHEDPAAFRALVETAVPAPTFRLRHVRSHMTDSVEGRRAALREMLPVLAELDEVTRAAYVRQTATELFLDEGIVTDALRRFLRQGAAEPLQNTAPQRMAVRQGDDALRRTGREIIAAIWRDPALLTEILSSIPMEDFPDELIAQLLCAMAAHLDAGGVLDADFIAAQPTAAGDELTRAIVEEGRTEASYQEALGTLRRSYLTHALARHTRRAEEMMQEGKEGYIDELNEVKKIQDEIARENLHE